jgi:hypothetical protein
MKPFTDSSPYSKLKYLLFSIQSKRGLQKVILSMEENILQEMAEGEVRILSI